MVNMMANTVLTTGRQTEKMLFVLKEMDLLFGNVKVMDILIVMVRIGTIAIIGSLTTTDI
jgi:hypothetical protein